MTMSSSPSSQWELESLGNIPHEVVSILLGSIPVVPDPRLEAQALESAKDQSRLEDRLSEDDDEEGDAMGSSQRLNHLKDVTMSMEIIKDEINDEEDDSAGEDTTGTRQEPAKRSKTTRRRDRHRGEDEIVLSEDSAESRPWNIPDDDWAWSDEEPVTNKPKESTRRGKHASSARDSSEVESHRRPASVKGRTGLGLSGFSTDERDDSVSSASNRTTPLSSDRSSDRGAPIIKHGATTAEKHAWKATHPHMTVAQDLKVSVCDRGDYIVCASKKMFAILTSKAEAIAASPPSTETKGGRSRWVLIGQGSGLDGPSDSITSVLCLPLYTPKSRQSQVYVVVGYHTGIIRVYNERGALLVVQQLHHTPVVSLKARIGSSKTPGEDEDEVTIVYQGGRVVCIEGESLWVALRMSNNQGSKGQERNIHAAQSPTFTYKKWHLQNQDHMVDVISCGPAPHRPTLSNGFSSAASSAIYSAEATERFVAVGSQPMMVFYASTNTGRPMFSATSISQVASRVTSAVFGLAKSFLSGASPLLRPSSPAQKPSSTLTPAGNGPYNNSHLSPATSTGSATPDYGRKRWSTGGPLSNTATTSANTATTSSGMTSSFDGGVSPTAMAPATEVPAILWLTDPQRCIRHVSLAPLPTRGTVHHRPSRLAAMTDSLGRVLLVDLEECEVVRMWKGLRGARCGWIQEEKLVPVERRSSPRSSPTRQQQQQQSPSEKVGVVADGKGVEADNVTTTDNDNNENNKAVEFRRHLMLYLVIYAPKRGTAEIYPMRHGPREALLHVGLGWKVCTTAVGPIGQPLGLNHHHHQAGSGAALGPASSSSSGLRPASPPDVSTKNPSPMPAGSSGLVQCFLMGPSGEVRLIQRKPQA
ncbi:Rab3 GTPase-activating protein non-catalytic subunit [Actinomortierella ambigua]|nr:Rab3 GTPase-activating protein non-catalytic subunit [Actinomortierella ambigua]